MLRFNPDVKDAEWDTENVPDCGSRVTVDGGTYVGERFEKRFLKSADVGISGSKINPEVTIRAKASRLCSYQ